MFLFDVKDFRHEPAFDVPVVEHIVLQALAEAGVEFDTPLSLRLRIKDIDIRMLSVRAEAVGDHYDDFRINLYFPPYPPPAEYVAYMNAEIRHQLTHIAQVRRPGGGGEFPAEQIAEFEKEAQRNALQGKFSLINRFLEP